MTQRLQWPDVRKDKILVRVRRFHETFNELINNSFKNDTCKCYSWRDTCAYEGSPTRHQIIKCFRQLKSKKNTKFKFYLIVGSGSPSILAANSNRLPSSTWNKSKFAKNAQVFKCYIVQKSWNLTIIIFFGSFSNIKLIFELFLIELSVGVLL